MLEDIINEFAVGDGISVIGAWDRISDVVNNGNFLVRRTTESVRFLARWKYIKDLKIRFRVRYGDNGEFIHLIETAEFSPIVSIAPQYRFNSYHTSVGPNNAGNNYLDEQSALLLHYPGAVFPNPAITTCGLIPARADQLLKKDDFEYCKEKSSIPRCFEDWCKHIGMAEKRVIERPLQKQCVVRPSPACLGVVNISSELAAQFPSVT